MSYEIEKARPGRHHIWFVELDVDFCQLRYGEGACPAVLGVDSERKCYNTEISCPVPGSYDPAPKTYRFTQAVENAPAGAVPNLRGVNLTPGKIDVAGGLGSRSVADLDFIDHPGSDLTVDPYLDDAGLDQSITTAREIAGGDAGDGTLAPSAEWVVGPILPAAVRCVGDPTSASMQPQADEDFTIEAWVKISAQPATILGSSSGGFLVTAEGGVVSIQYDVYDTTDYHIEAHTTDGVSVFFAFPYADPTVQVFFNGGLLWETLYTHEVGVGITFTPEAGIPPAGFEIIIKTPGSPPQVPEVRGVIAGFPSDQWAHLAIRREGGVLTGLVNGTPYAPPLVDDATLVLDFSAQDYFVNRSATGRQIAPWRIDEIGGMTGSVSDVRVWDIPRSDLQINLRHRDRLTGEEPGLIAYWPLDDGWVQARDYNPLDVGTYWGKFRARNPYYHSRPIRVWSGYLSDPDDLSTFDYSNAQRRDYLLDKISGPDSRGRVRITAKDPLKMVDSDRAVAPRPSKGKLADNISEGDGIVVTVDVPNGINIGDEYPSSGYARIGREVVRFSRTGTSFNLFERGVRNTEISSHEADDAFQLCLDIPPQTVDGIVRMLLVDYADVPAEFVPDAEWAAEVNQYLAFSCSAFITEPVGIKDLLKELGQQAPHQLFWDERVNLIKLQAVKEPDASAPVFSDETHFIEGGTSPSDDPKKRVSVVVVNFAQIDPTEKLDEPRNFKASYVRADLERERQYGGRKIVTFNSRWMDSGDRVPAEIMAALIGRRFGATPRTLRFSLDAKDSNLWTGDLFFAKTRFIQGMAGAPEQTPFQVLSVKEGGNGAYQYEAMEYKFDPPGPNDPTDDEYPVTLSVDENNINLYDRYRTRWSGAPAAPDKPVRFTVSSNITIGSAFITKWAMETGNWPPGSAPLILELESSTSTIVGRGGEGGPGLSVEIGDALPPAQDGQPGGPALLVSHPITIINNGVIAGGGGGGGGAGGRLQVTIFEPCGGGGGAGRIPGAGGYAEGAQGIDTHAGTDGSSTNPLTPGVGGDSAGDWKAGDGGTPGIAGQAGSGGSHGGLYFGAGGLPGNSIDGAANITFELEGDIRGPRSN